MSNLLRIHFISSSVAIAIAKSILSLVDHRDEAMLERRGSEKVLDVTELFSLPTIDASSRQTDFSPFDFPIRSYSEEQVAQPFSGTFADLVISITCGTAS